jgi:hypothetical protein
MANSLFNWDFRSRHVQPDIEEEDAITSESTLVAFGPSSLQAVAAGISGAAATIDARSVAIAPAGVVENFTVSLGQQVIKLYEIGSSRAYMIGGRSDGQLSVARGLFNGPNLPRLMYAAFKDKSAAGFKPIVEANAPGVRTVDTGDIPPGTINAGGRPTHDFFANFQNPLFRIPFGTLMFMKDQAGRSYTGFYFESCLIATYGMGTSASGLAIQEAVGLRFDRALPVNVRFSV